MAFYGTNMWFAVQHILSQRDGQPGVQQIGGTRARHPGRLPTASQPAAIRAVWFFDGTSLWVANFGSNTISKIAVDRLTTSPTGSELVTTIPLPANSRPNQLGFGGANIWATLGNGNLVKLQGTNGTVLLTIPMPGALSPKDWLSWCEHLG